MREEEFRAWLNRQNIDISTVNMQVARARRLDRDIGNLDQLFDADRFAAALKSLTYSQDDKRRNAPNPSQLVIDGDLYNNLASYRATLGYYQRFRDSEKADLTGDDRFDTDLDRMVTEFRARLPDFSGFDRREGTFWETEGAYKLEVQTKIARFAADPNLSDDAFGREVFKALAQGKAKGLPLSWRIAHEVANAGADLQTRFFGTVAQVARLQPGDNDGLSACARALEALRREGMVALKRGEVLCITLSVYGTVNPEYACWFKVRLFDRLAKRLTGRTLFSWDDFEIDDVLRFQGLMSRIRQRLTEEGWSPSSMMDVQGFVWVVMDDDYAVADTDGLSREAVQQAMDECREIGLQAFLSKYGFGHPRDYWVRRADDEALYPAKATVGAAYGFMPGGKAQSAKEFHGGFGEQAANSILKRLGFEIVTKKSAIPASADTEEPKAVPTPKNLILHGPPGTGKTWRTAAEALRLCGEVVPDDRVTLMARYHELQEEGRIEFVTFHQSMSYEDFVEGRQPTTGDEDEEASTGFRLETVPGILRRIARRAETSRGKVAGANRVEVGKRQIFKTSIGDASDPADEYLFKEAIEGGYTLLGFDDIDWSDDAFAKREAIIAACQKADGANTPLNAMHARVQMPFIFRNWVKPGDIVIVSKGTGLFRAIGVVTGQYEFHPREDGGYAHRRKVDWLWVDQAGVPVSEIYQSKFSMRTIYLMYDDKLNVAALERYMNSRAPAAGTAADPEQFVLIIDEINRANISKVFGELITLLEPDKRIGQPNELRVQLPYSKAGERFGLPSNLHILGTMNTADRSIALLDTALRRRFEFREVMPEPELLTKEAADTGINLPTVLRTLNERVEYLFDREHQIGHAYLLGCESRADLDNRMRHKIIPLLAEYFHEDMAKVAAVLGDPDGKRFLERKTLKPPPGFEDDGPEIVRWTVRPVFSDDAYTGLM